MAYSQWMDPAALVAASQRAVSWCLLVVRTPMVVTVQAVLESTVLWLMGVMGSYIPSIDTTQHGTWARELFTVNRNGQSLAMIGFAFSSQFSLRTTEIVLFQCPIQGIGITGIKVYSSFLFPQFIVAASILLTMLNSPPSENCQSLSTISIPVQPPLASYNLYFIEFLYTGGSSVLQLNWLHLGEVRFSDHYMSPTVATVAILTTQLGESTTSSVRSTNSLEAATTLTINDDDVMLNTSTT